MLTVEKNRQIERLRTELHQNLIGEDLSIAYHAKGKLEEVIKVLPREGYFSYEELVCEENAENGEISIEMTLVMKDDQYMTEDRLNPLYAGDGKIVDISFNMGYVRMRWAFPVKM